MHFPSVTLKKDWMILDTASFRRTEAYNPPSLADIRSISQRHFRPPSISKH